MEIIIGSMPPLTQQSNKSQEKNTGTIEARLLHVRRPRRGIAGPSGMERRGKKTNDPRKGRVLTILIPDADQLPSDIDQGEYNVYIRFGRK